MGDYGAMILMGIVGLLCGWTTAGMKQEDKRGLIKMLLQAATRQRIEAPKREHCVTDAPHMHGPEHIDKRVKFLNSDLDAMITAQRESRGSDKGLLLAVQRAEVGLIDLLEDIDAAKGTFRRTIPVVIWDQPCVTLVEASDPKARNVQRWKRTGSNGATLTPHEHKPALPGWVELKHAER